MKTLRSTGILLLALMLSILSFAQNTLKITPGAVLDLNGGVILTLQDYNLDNDGTLSPPVGAGRVIFKGAANNFIRGTGLTNFDELQISKGRNAVLTLQTNLDIRSGIWFGGGLIDLDNRVVTLLGNSALNDESELSRIIASRSGYVQVSMQLNAVKEANPGNLGAIISTGKNLGLTNIRRGHLPQTLDVGINSIHRYYDILPENNTALNATLVMQYADTELGDHAEGALEFRFSPDGKFWEKRKSSSRNTSLNFVVLNNIDVLGRITLSDDNVGLPVSFASFTVTCTSTEAVVNWVTASEQNSSHFEVQRSANGTDWTNLATVPAAGNSSAEKRYSYTDPQPQGKYYRVREVDLDGQTQFSPIAVADCQPGIAFKSWPNPVHDKLFITLKADKPGSAAVQVFNSIGKLVKKYNNGVLAGNNQLALAMHTLSTGYYHIEVVWNDTMRKSITIFKK